MYFRLELLGCVSHYVFTYFNSILFLSISYKYILSGMHKIRWNSWQYQHVVAVYVLFFVFSNKAISKELTL